MNYGIWEKIIRKNPQCIIMVQTNGTILTDRVKDILSRGNFQLGVSLDSLKKETYESIRLNANFDKVMENIQYFNEYCKRKKVKFSIAVCAMRQNWKELPEFVRFCNSMDAVLTIHKVWFPREYALHNLPSEQLSEIHQYLSGFDFPTDTRLKELNRDHYRYFVSVTADWLDTAVKFKKEVPSVYSLSGDQLMAYLEEKLKNNIEEDNKTSAEKRKELEDSLSKLQAVLDKFNDPQQKEEALRRMCLTPVAEIRKVALKHSSDFLFKQAKEYMKEGIIT
jgi:hypothetical protein